VEYKVIQTLHETSNKVQCNNILSVFKSSGGGPLSVQSGDIVYSAGAGSVSESDIDIVLSRDAVDQSAAGTSHNADTHQQVSLHCLSKRHMYKFILNYNRYFVNCWHIMG